MRARSFAVYEAALITLLSALLAMDAYSRDRPGFVGMWLVVAGLWLLVCGLRLARGEQHD
jgi:hypothetical protein